MNAGQRLAPARVPGVGIAAKRSTSGWKWVRVAVVLLLVAALVAYVAFIRLRAPLPVETATVTQGAITVSFTADGVVKAKTVDLAPKSIGRVDELLVREGDRVRRGQTVARLDSRELDAAVDSALSAVDTAQANIRESEAAVELARQQAAARQAQARAQLAAAESELAKVESGARPQEIARARHEVDAAQAHVEASEKTLKRTKLLVDEGVIPKAQLEQAEEAYRSALAQLNAARQGYDLLQSGARKEDRASAIARRDAALADLRSAESLGEEIKVRQATASAARARYVQALSNVAQARSAQDTVTLKSPIDGVVSRIPVEVGDMVSPQAPVMMLLTQANRWVQADIADEDASKVRVGQMVSVNIPAYPGRRFKGKIFELAPQAELKPDAALQTRIVRAKITLLEHPELFRSGLEVDVQGESTVVDNAVLIPSDALVFRENRNVVYIVEDGEAREREVQTGYFTHNLTEVLSGVVRGDEVIVKGKDQAKDGRRVKVRKPKGG